MAALTWQAYSMMPALEFSPEGGATLARNATAAAAAAAEAAPPPPPQQLTVDHLPDELLAKIFANIDPIVDVPFVLLVCKRWQAVMDGELERMRRMKRRRLATHGPSDGARAKDKRQTTEAEDGDQTTGSIRATSMSDRHRLLLQGTKRKYKTDNAMCTFWPKRRRTLLASAARSGQLSRIAWLCRKGALVDGPIEEAFASRRQYMTRLKCLVYYPQPRPWHMQAGSNAAKGGSIGVLRWVCAHGCAVPLPSCVGAVKNGHTLAVRWLYRHGCFSNAVLLSAVECGETRLARWLCARGCVWSATTYTRAACVGHLANMRWALNHLAAYRDALAIVVDINKAPEPARHPTHRAMLLAWQHVHGMKIGNGAFVSAIYRNDTTTLRRAIIGRGLSKTDFMRCAAHCGNLAIMRWLQALLPIAIDRTTGHWVAASEGHMAALEWLCAHGKRIRHRDVSIAAASSGCLDVVRQVVVRHGCPRTYGLLDEAIGRQDMAIVRWAVSSGVCRWRGQESDIKATKSNSLSILRWSSGHGLSTPGAYLYTAAIQSANAAFRSWTHVHGAPVPKRVFNVVVRLGRIEPLRWALANRFNWTLSTTSLASVSSTLHVLRWVCAHGCPQTAQSFYFTVLHGDPTALAWQAAHGSPIDWEACDTVLARFCSDPQRSTSETLVWLRNNRSVPFFRNAGHNEHAASM